MRQCRKIEQLLYLYREDELSEKEKSIVDSHVNVCPHCASVLGELRNIDNALSGGRTAALTMTGDQVMVETIISHRAGKKYLALLSVETISRRVRPALGIVVFTAMCLFFLQQSRDTIKISSLEHRQQERGDNSTPSLSIVDLEYNSSTMLPPQTAGMLDRPYGTVRTILLRMLGREDGLIDELAKKYPNLSRVKFDDGLDDVERYILATEGKSFLKEFEQLMKQGE